MFSYLPVEPSDHPIMTALYEQYLNGGSSVSDYIKDGFELGNIIGVKCVYEDKIVGVFTARPGIQFTCGHEDLVLRIAELFKENIVSGDMIVVLPEFRGKGIAREMTAQLLKMLLDRGYKYFVAEMWNHADDHDMPAFGSVKRLGSVVFEEAHELFYADLYKQGLTCPECGIYCKCSALVSVIKLEGLK